MVSDWDTVGISPDGREQFLARHVRLTEQRPCDLPPGMSHKRRWDGPTSSACREHVHLGCTGYTDGYATFGCSCGCHEPASERER